MKNTCCGNGKTNNMASMMDMMSSNGFNPMNMCKDMMQGCSNTTKDTDSNQGKSFNGFDPMDMCKEMMQGCSNTTKDTDSNQGKSFNGFAPMSMCKEMMQRCLNTTKETDSHQGKCSCSMSKKSQSDMSCC